jgi:hypothetical protein
VFRGFLPMFVKDRTVQDFAVLSMIGFQQIEDVLRPVGVALMVKPQVMRDGMSNHIEVFSASVIVHP